MTSGDYELCESLDVIETVERWTGNAHLRRLAAKYEQMTRTLAVYGQQAPPPAFKKLGRVLYRFRVDDQRVYYGFPARRRIALTRVEEKKTDRLSARKMDLLERQVRAHIDAIDALDTGCPEAV